MSDVTDIPLEDPSVAAPETTVPADVPPEDQWIYDEFQQTVGRPPTEDEYKNWKKYGHPGQILVELGGGMKTVTTDSGQTVKVYTDLSKAGDNFVFNYSSKEGEVFAVPQGTKVADGSNYKLLGTKDGYDIYGNAGEQSGGLVGGIDNLLGTDFSGTIDKVIPNELKAGGVPAITDPLGITQTFLFGDKFNKEGLSAVADLTGTKASEMGQVQNYAKTGAKIAAAFVPGIGPFLSAGLDIADNVAQTTGNDQPLSDTAKRSALDLILATSVTRMTTGSWLPSMPSSVPAATASPDVPSSHYDELASPKDLASGAPADVNATQAPTPAGPTSFDELLTPTLATSGAGGGAASAAAGSGAGGAPVASPAVPNNATFVDSAGNPAAPATPPKSVADFMGTVPEGMQSTITVGPTGNIQNMTISPKPIPPPAPVNPWLQFGIPAGALLLGGGLQFYGSMLALKKQEDAMKQAAELNKQAMKYQAEWQQAQLDAETQMFYDQLEAEKGSSTPHDSGSMYAKGSI